ncbi:pentapeptide repeat-containing protein [Streptomyces sp. NPDC047065]|uniref:pentapeptide repeat-containing protein n=1 Tax=Streptomyces sp. NPDC047065 TaxID=3154606 RepID=UPI0033C16F4A
MSTSEPPTWPHCAHDADPAANPVGCRGIHVPSHTTCLAHLADADRDAYLAGLTAGASIDHRGTTFTEPLLNALLNALYDPATGNSRLGDARLGSATFMGRADFESATFTGSANFESATFSGLAKFGRHTFKGNAYFALATFEGLVAFGLATFPGEASFMSATFKGDAYFALATFESRAEFGSATFEREADFKGATFIHRAWFWAAIFQGYTQFESATFKGDAGFGLATFTDGAKFRAVAFEGHAEFESGVFEGHAMFESATFEGRAEFRSATFKGYTCFMSATFEHRADFRSATFSGIAQFESVIFTFLAEFESAIFEGHALFDSATFLYGASFRSATFTGDAWFRSATFACDAGFELATFKKAHRLGPLVCTERVVLSGAVFGNPVTISLAARGVEFHRTHWSSTAEIRLRYATVDFAHAVFEYPLTIAAEPDLFVLDDGRHLIEDVFPSAYDPGVRMASLRGVDAAHLVLSDLDLWDCLFSGTVHLDQIRLEGACTFNTAPSARHWRHWPPVRFTERRVLAEEHHWRASRPGAVQGWVHGPGRAGPLQLAPVYRALRKAFEDQKHEPGAADFYYGEMEMRRHASDIPRSERGLLTAYWALSGYGLRASRALAWLGTAMLLTIVLLMAFGLAQDSPKQTATGTVPAGGGKVTFEIDKDDAQNPTGDRLTSKRFEKALNVTLNSVVFRSSGQDLTTAGTYIEMTSRLTEPVLLGLAVLAVRNRVKR